MKIVQICRLYKPHLGGVETHVAELNKCLVADKHQVMVLTTQHDGRLPLREERDNITILRLPVAADGKKLATWRWVWQHRYIFFEADIVQVHDIFWWVLPVWLLISKKIYTTFHGWEGIYPVRITAKLQRWVWNKMSQATMHVGDWIREFYWDKPTLVVYGGITVPELNKPMATKKTEFVFYGRLSPENEIEKYLQLIKVLKKNHPEITMTWVGDGPLVKACQKVGEVTGMVADPIPFLDQATFVFSSSYLSMLQAQVLGKVVCAFYSNPLKQRYLETYPGSQSMLLASSVSEMSEMIEKLLAGPQSVVKLSRSVQSFARRQTWQRVTETYYQLWQE